MRQPKFQSLRFNLIIVCLLGIGVTNRQRESIKVGNIAKINIRSGVQGNVVGDHFDRSTAGADGFLCGKRQFATGDNTGICIAIIGDVATCRQGYRCIGGADLANNKIAVGLKGNRLKIRTGKVVQRYRGCIVRYIKCQMIRCQRDCVRTTRLVLIVGIFDNKAGQC